MSLSSTFKYASIGTNAGKVFDWTLAAGACQNRAQHNDAKSKINEREDNKDNICIEKRHIRESTSGICMFTDLTKKNTWLKKVGKQTELQKDVG